MQSHAISLQEAKEGTCKVKGRTVDVGDLVKTLRGKGVVLVGCEFDMELSRY